MSTSDLWIYEKNIILVEIEISVEPFSKLLDEIHVINNLTEKLRAPEISTTNSESHKMLNQKHILYIPTFFT